VEVVVCEWLWVQEPYFYQCDGVYVFKHVSGLNSVLGILLQNDYTLMELISYI
jgi:hypothetical protein